jgi:hypothetical protein
MAEQHVEGTTPPHVGGGITGSSGSADSPLRTLFVGGLPHDCAPREIRNLFLLCEGFESFQMNMSPHTQKSVPAMTQDTTFI